MFFEAADILVGNIAETAAYAFVKLNVIHVEKL